MSTTETSNSTPGMLSPTNTDSTTSWKELLDFLETVPDFPGLQQREVDLLSIPESENYSTSSETLEQSATLNRENWNAFNTITLPCVNQTTYEALFTPDEGSLVVTNVDTAKKTTAKTVVAGFMPSRYKADNTWKTLSSTSLENNLKTKLQSCPLNSKDMNSKRTNWPRIFHEMKWTTWKAYVDALTRDDERAIMFYQSIKERDSMRKVVTEMINRASILDHGKPYNERLASHNVKKSDLDPEEIKICNTVVRLLDTNVQVTNQDFYPRNLELHGQKWTKVWWTIANIHKILIGRGGKKRGLIFYGKPSSGKSMLAALITACIPPEQVGRFNMQGSKSNFWFQGLLNKEFYLGEEIVLENQSAQTLKLLLENSDTLVTDVKFSEHIHVDPQPVIITSNDPPYTMCNGERGAFLERALELYFVQQTEAFISRNRNKQARAWAVLVAEALSYFPLKEERCASEYELIF